MLIRRLKLCKLFSEIKDYFNSIPITKLFGKREAVINKELITFFKDFYNADEKYKNLSALRNLSNRDLINLSKVLPNHLTDSSLFKDGKIEIPNEVWKSIKGTRYFKNRESNELPKDVKKAIKKRYLSNTDLKAEDITRKDFENHINNARDRANMSYEDKLEYLKKNKPDVYKYVTSSDHGKAILKAMEDNYGFRLEKAIGLPEFSDLKNKSRFFKNTSNLSKEIEDLKKDPAVKRNGVEFFENDVLNQFNPFSNTKGNISKEKAEKSINETKAYLKHAEFNKEEELKKLENNKRKTVNKLEGKYDKFWEINNPETLKDYEDLRKNLNKAGLSFEDFAESETTGDRQKIAIFDEVLKGNLDSSKLEGNFTFLPLMGKSGSPSHEIGHIIEEAHSKYIPDFFNPAKPEVARLKNELRYTRNHTGPIQQLGNEGMASLRGLSRYKGENKEQATKNMLDAYSSYLDCNDNARKIIRGIFKKKRGLTPLFF